ncbi:MAG: double zinc ribbon domain-containing protein [Candidatus Hodarchaeales archaeon]|jgi:predicted amidophosphoribosyltransferase
MNTNDKSLEMIDCPKCNQTVPKTDFCILCGAKFSIEEKKPPLEIENTRICPYCGKNIPNTTYCIHCGKKIEDPPTPVSNEQQCPLCRQDIPENHHFCHNCGARLKKSVTSESQTVICNQCWKPNPPNTSFCIHCGATNLGKKARQIYLLEQPFQGFQIDLPQLLKHKTVPLSLIKQGSSRSFPVKSTILHSRFFGVVQKNRQTLSFLNKNFGAFNSDNLMNYAGSFLIILAIYVYWFFSFGGLPIFEDLFLSLDPISNGITAIISSIILTSLLLMPIWLASMLVFRKSGYRINYRLDSSRVMITVIFNLFWGLLFGGGPIILRLGDIKNTEERAVRNRSFIRGIAFGSIYTVTVTAFLSILTLMIFGIGVSGGFLFQDQLISVHALDVFFGATWITLILILPLGDFYDRVLKQWNIVIYLIMIAAAILFLLYSFEVLEILNPITAQRA